VLPSRLLAGAYPGHQDPTEHQERVHAFVDAGIRLFVNLMEEDETNHAGQAFAPYAEVAGRHSPAARMSRYAILDQSVPTRSTMTAILNAIDESLVGDSPVYVHCWGGVGRTGTVIGCWLLRHGLASPANVLDVLGELRQQDQERRHRISPETPDQRQFVQQWLTKGPEATHVTI
jgi:protein tyrosine/serine phosphatase